MICLSKRQILFLHEELIWETGGSPGLQDEALLDSALAAPFQTFDGQPLYPSLQQKAACLCYGLVMDHLFLDGNKRIGAHAMEAELTMESPPSSCGSPRGRPAPRSCWTGC